MKISSIARSVVSVLKAFKYEGNVVIEDNENNIMNIGAVFRKISKCLNFTPPPPLVPLSSCCKLKTLCFLYT